MLYALITGISHRTMNAESAKSNAAEQPVAEKQQSKDLKSPTQTPEAAAMMDSSCSDAESEASHSNATAENRMPSGLILKTGRVRLPDKLMEYLNNDVAPEALFWMPEGESFAIDTEKAPGQLLNKYFGGTKVASFLRSISRWGFKRVFYHELDKHIYAFHHPLFKKDSPHLEREMKMIVSAPSESKRAKKKSKAKKETERAIQNPSVETLIPSLICSSPAVASQESAVTLPSASTVLAAVAQPNLTASASLSALTGQQLGPSALTAPAARGESQALLERLLQIHQHATSQPALGLTGLLQRRPDEQLAQLLALQGAATNEGAGASSSTLQADIVRLAVARQLQHQQQQQQQAMLNLLSALQNNNTQG